MAAKRPEGSVRRARPTQTMRPVSARRPPFASATSPPRGVQPVGCHKTSSSRDAPETLRLDLGGDVQRHPGDSHEQDFDDPPRLRHLRERRWSPRRLGPRAALLFPRQSAAGLHPWHPVRRCRRNQRHGVDAHRSPVARHVRSVVDGKFRQCHSPCAARYLAGQRLHGEAAAHRPRLRPGHLLPHDGGRSRRHQRRFRADRRPLPDGAGLEARHSVRLVGRHRRPGLGHRRYRHEDLRHDRQAHAGLLPAFRRHHLCRRRDEGRGRPARWRQVEEHRAHRRQAQGRRNAGRIPGPVEIQHDGQERAGPQRHLPDLLPVGRP